MNSQIQGWVTEDELDWLSNRAKKNKTILEIGCWKGRSTKVICDNSSEDSKIITIDNFEGDPLDPIEHSSYKPYLEAGEDIEKIFRENLKDYLESGKLTLLKTDSKHAWLPVPNFGFDWVFIDGNHRYENVFNDIFNATNRWGCKLISGHDIDLPGVHRAVREILGEVEIFNKIWFKKLRN